MGGSGWPMTDSASNPLRDDAFRVWRSALAAVDSTLLVRRNVECSHSLLRICGHQFSSSQLGRICVVGGGKAGAGMVAGLEAVFAGTPFQEKVSGWVNVPEDCVRATEFIHLHPARPAGLNEPTAEGVRGTLHILNQVKSLRREDLCLVLLSGGGSALLPAPKPPVTLAAKQVLTRRLSRAGASIQELNCVRKQLSLIKGGGLARACGAGVLICMVISDVIGDPLETIASGPAIPSTETPADALAVLAKYRLDCDDDPEIALAVAAIHNNAGESETAQLPQVFHHVIGNNATALEAAKQTATDLGYCVAKVDTDQSGVACEVGRQFAQECRKLRDDGGTTVRQCVLSGGEPTVHVVDTDRPQKGGRNQELVLAAVQELWDDGMDRLALLSGGTDGEDGPTDAAGAVADADLIRRAKQLGLDPGEFLQWNNSYPFFDQSGGLLQTGPTQTNVMDVRVGLIDGPGR